MTTKPNLTRTWASSAPASNIEDPDVTSPGKYAAGYQIEVLTYKNLNYLFQNLSQGLAHANEEGIMVWDADTNYPLHGRVKGSDGQTYISKVGSNQGNNPVSSPSEWFRDTHTTYYAASGSAGSYILNPVGPSAAAPNAYYGGMEIVFYPHVPHNGSATVDVGGLGPKGLYTQNSSNVSLEQGRYITARFNEVLDRFDILVGHIATNTLPGSIRIATQAEVDQGTSNSTAVTPATLEGKVNSGKSSGSWTNTPVNSGAGTSSFLIPLNGGAGVYQVEGYASGVFINSPGPSDEVSSLLSVSSTVSSNPQISTYWESSISSSFKEGTSATSVHPWLNQSSGQARNFVKVSGIIQINIGQPDINVAFVMSTAGSNVDLLIDFATLKCEKLN